MIVPCQSRRPLLFYCGPVSMGAGMYMTCVTAGCTIRLQSAPAGKAPPHTPRLAAATVVGPCARAGRPLIQLPCPPPHPQNLDTSFRHHLHRKTLVVSHAYTTRHMAKRNEFPHFQQSFVVQVGFVLDLWFLRKTKNTGASGQRTA